MIRTPQDMRALAHELATSAWTLGAIGALSESGLIEHLCESRAMDDLASRCHSLSKSRIERCLSVAAAAGVVVAEGARYRLADGALPFVQQPMRAALRPPVLPGRRC